MIDIASFSFSGPYRGNGLLAGEPEPGEPLGAGLTTIAGVPASCRIEVRLYRTRTVVAETRSNADGEWRVAGINPDYFYDIIASDPTEAYDPVVRLKQAPYVA